MAQIPIHTHEPRKCKYHIVSSFMSAWEIDIQYTFELIQFSWFQDFLPDFFRRHAALFVCSKSLYILLYSSHHPPPARSRSDLMWFVCTRPSACIKVFSSARGAHARLVDYFREMEEILCMCQCKCLLLYSTLRTCDIDFPYVIYSSSYNDIWGWCKVDMQRYTAVTHTQIYRTCKRRL